MYEEHFSLIQKSTTQIASQGVGLSNNQAVTFGMKKKLEIHVVTFEKLARASR